LAHVDRCTIHRDIPPKDKGCRTIFSTDFRGSAATCRATCGARIANRAAHNSAEISELYRIKPHFLCAFELPMSDSDSGSANLNLHPLRESRNLACADGRVVRFTILSPDSPFAQQASHLERLCIPSSIEVISKNCFRGNKRLFNVAFEFGSKIATLGHSAFDECGSLQSICLPSSIDTISESCFRDCTKLSVSTFDPGSKICNLGKSAFRGCSSLQSICIPSSINPISYSCFSNCTNLSILRFEPGSAILNIEDYTFGWCSSLQSLFIPARLREMTGSALTASGVSSVFVETWNRFFGVSASFLVDLAETRLKPG
jgi:hypothetical protein